jgi:kynurenine formamidase
MTDSLCCSHRLSAANRLKNWDGALLAIGIITYTGLQGLERLSGETDFMFYGFPVRIVGGDGSPVHAVAVVDE